jgi:uncharacterized protein involved in outer membrane biogenesis
MTFLARRWRTILMIATAAVLLLLLIAAAFPWGVLKGVVADRLAQRFGRPVVIEQMTRVDRFGFRPTIAVAGVRIPQPGWAGPGDFVRLGHAEVTFPLWPLLGGSFRPRNLRVDRLALALVRTQDGRTNWSRPGKPESGGASTDLKGLTISNSTIAYRDEKRNRSVALRFSSDATHGVQASGSGVIRGAPVRISFAGAPVDRPQPGPWPFVARLDGARLAMVARGTTDRPLDTNAMTLDVTARAADLRLIDAVIEAGLFGTQPVTLAAHVRHDAPDWTITALKGTIGRSDIAGHLTVRKRDGRTRLDGAIAAQRFDFADLSSDEGRASGAALERRIGPRIVPDTRISLATIKTTDGVLAFRIARVFSGSGDSSIIGVRGTATLDHQRLTVAPLAVALPSGVIRGTATVDQRGGAALPRLGLDLRLTGSRVEAFAGAGGSFTGRVQAHAQLSGRGDTIRAAIARADGRIGFTVRDGALPARYAAAAGFDAGRVLLAGRDDRASLRCLILTMPVANGQGRASPLIVDTSESQLTGQGRLSFPGETLDLRFTGAPKRHSLLRVPGAVFVRGTLSDPALVIPPEIRSAGNIFKALGRAITGHQGPQASDANCAALAARALR